jgi:hypothetical protein
LALKPKVRPFFHAICSRFMFASRRDWATKITKCIKYYFDIGLLHRFCCVVFLSQNAGTFRPCHHSICYEHLMDRGWSMNLSSAFIVSLFALAIVGLAQANNQQAQQSCVNAAICLLAIRSGLSPGRRSDLTSFAWGNQCCPHASRTINQAVL